MAGRIGAVGLMPRVYDRSNGLVPACWLLRAQECRVALSQERHAGWSAWCRDLPC